MGRIALLQTLPIFSPTALELARDDLPDLRSFGGHHTVAPRFIPRSVLKLELGSRFSLRVTHVSLASSYVLTHLPDMDTHLATYNPENDVSIRNYSDGVLGDLKTIGGGIQMLSARFEASPISLRYFSSCFPNLDQLEIKLCTP